MLRLLSLPGVASQAPGGAGVCIGREFALDNDAIGVAKPLSGVVSPSTSSVSGSECDLIRGERWGGNGVLFHAPGGLGVFIDE